MTRSYKRVAGSSITTARSDKPFKVSEHRKFRRIIRYLISRGVEDNFPTYGGKFGDPWCSPKDGKCVWYWSLEEFLRTEIIGERVRTNSWYVGYNGKMYQRWKYTERSATVGDWKKDWIGK